MKKYHLLYIASTLFLAGLTSCEDTLTEEPDSSYKKEQFFTSESKAEMAIYGIYHSIEHSDHYGSVETVTPASDDTYYMNGTNIDNIRRDIAHYVLTPSNA